MFHTRLFLLLTVLCVGLARAEEGDVPFKSRTYSTEKRLDSRSYTASAYSPSTKASSTSSSFKPSEKGHWSFFSSKKKAITEKQAEATPAKAGDPYVQKKEQTTAATIETDSKSVPEIKPFKPAGKKLTHTVYKPQAPTNEKNPMLAPRQGIKAHE